MGQVYRARDKQLGRDVALKFLPDGTRPDSTAVHRFLREARAASALNHPNIVTIYEAGEVEAGHFISMELVKGRTLRMIKERPLPMTELLRLAIQMVKALAAAHAAGIIHRDIKMENIMVRDDGYIKILDFGLAQLKLMGLPHEWITLKEITSDSGLIIGTLRYMSPEQAGGRSLTVATDIFSLGIVLYELATGKHPFEGESQLTVLNAILTQRAIAPSRLNPEIPVWLDELLLRMLDKNPLSRPSSGDLVAAFEPANQRSLDSAAALVAAERHSVGRQTERSAMRTTFDGIGKGRGELLCVAGEPGIGKTTFVEDFFAEIALSGQKCLVGRGRSSERLAETEAYLPFLEALESLLYGDEGPTIAQMMKVLAPTWYAQLVPLPTVGDSADHLRAELRSGSLERLKRELVAFLREASSAHPIALFFDDLHWADASTVDVLAYLATRLEHMAVLVIVTYRPEELFLRKHPFLQIRSELQARGACRQLSLEFLSREDISRYLALEYPDHRFPESFPDLIHSKTEGNPLFMADVLRYLRDRQVIAKANGHWSLVQSVPDIEKVLPESVRGMIQRKIDLIDQTDRKLLMTASIEGFEFEAAVVASAMGIEPADVEDRLDELERVHAIVKRVSEREFPDHTLTLRYRFVHVLYQNALYALFSPARKTSVSTAVAKAVEGFYGNKTSEVASRLAVLWESARDFPRASEYFLTASKNATHVFAHREAVILARRGLELLKMMQDGTDRRRRELNLLLTMGVPLIVTLGFASSEVQQAYARARELCEELGESDRLFNVLRGLWTVNMVRLQVVNALPLAQELERLAESRKPALEIHRNVIGGLTSYYLGEYSAARQKLETARTLYDPAEAHYYSVVFPFDPAMECDANLARIRWAQGCARAAVQHAVAAVKLSRELKHFHSLVYSLYFRAVIHFYCGEVPQFETVVAEMKELAAELRLTHFSAVAEFLGQWGLLLTGDAEKAVALMEQGLANYRAVEAHSSVPHFISVIAEQYAHQGNTTRGLELIAEAFALTEKGGRYFDAELWRVKALLLVKQGRAEDREEADACLNRAFAISREQGTKYFELRAAMDLVEFISGAKNELAAQDVLGGACRTFIDDFDFPDLQRAKALLG
jgi:tetratricopeptide (TPR) repeat protein